MGDTQQGGAKVKRWTAHIQAWIDARTKARLKEFAERRYDGNVSMATRHVIGAGLQALDPAHKQQRQQAA